MKYVHDAAVSENIESPAYSSWRTQRLDRLVADYFLRHGLLESANQLAIQGGLSVSFMHNLTRNWTL